MNNLNKIESLNLVDLDVTELERRLELSVMTAAQDGPWLCIGNGCDGGVLCNGYTNN